MFRRHFFLVFAVVLVLAMAGLASYKMIFAKKPAAGGPAGGPQAAAGAGRSGGPGAPGGAPGGAAGRGGGRGSMTVGGTPVVQRQFADRVEVLGVAKGRESVILTSNNTEMVTAVRFRPGQRVNRGQVLLELKTDEEDAQIVQAQNQVNQAKSDADRWKTLADRGVAPRATAEQYQTAYQNALATLRGAQARRGDRVIRAPFSGTVGLSDVAPGTLISPGTSIATLDDTSVIRVDFDVPDRFLSLIHEGQPITAKTDAYPDRVHQGVIAKIDTRVDERTRAIKARAEFRNGDGQLKPGMLMRVGVERGNRMSMAVPESAVQFSADNSYVYVLTPRQPQGGPGQAGQAGQAGGAGQPQGQRPAQAPGQGAPAGGAARAGGPGAGGPGAGGPGGGRPGGGGAPPCSMVLAQAEQTAQAGRGGPQAAGAAPAGPPAKPGPAAQGAAPGQPGQGGANGGRRGGGGRPATADQRPVVAGLIENGFVEIKEGLRPGEFVIAEGLNKIQPGQPVSWCMAAPLVRGDNGRTPTGPGGPAGPGGGRPGMAPGGARGAGPGQFRGGNGQGRPGAFGGRRAGAAN